VLGYGLVNKLGGGFLELHCGLGDAKVLGVPLLGEVIAVVDEASAAIHNKRVSTEEVLWLIVLLGTKRHSGAVSEDGRLCKPLSLKEHREGISTTVLFSNLLDLDSTV